MSQTGVLPFVRGIDFTKYNLDEDSNQIRLLSDMQRLRWIRLNNVGIATLPAEIYALKKLEQIHAVRNSITSIHKDLTKLSCLRVLNLRHNSIRNAHIPNNLNDLEDLAVLDLSHNELTEVPTNVEEAKSVLVLNLSHNTIPTIPNYLFINLTDLVYLDLSNNKLEMLPPQLRRLLHLKSLILNNNPLLHAQLRQLPALVSLEVLQLKNTQRTANNMPQALDNLHHLKDIDLSCNQLVAIPDAVYKIKSLRRFNFSENCLAELQMDIGNLDELVSLNLSRNKLLALPNALCKLSRLRTLYVNSNSLTFVGIPAGVGKLSELQIFSASDNRLEMLPEGVCRCGKLRKLILNKNRLYTLPESIHFLQLQELDVSDNPDFQMPPKPIEMQKAIGAGALFYNIDFSLQHQLRLAGATPQQISAANTNDSLVTTPVKDPIARKKRLKLLKQHNNESESSKVLKGMRDAAASKKQALSNVKERQTATGKELDSLIKGKRWEEQLEKPKIDYSEFFEEDVGSVAGIVCYEIEKFLPSPVDSALNGKFYEGDCYIVLKTYIDETSSLNWNIYFWIGSQATLDKQACAAMHAVNLRNLLGATCRTQREEQNDESDEFLELFGSSLMYIEGARTISGFYTVEDVEYLTRMYKISGSHRLALEPVPLQISQLNTEFVYLLDDGMAIYVWMGSKSNPITRSKARLFAEKINKHERKFQAELVVMKEGCEEVDKRFMSLLDITNNTTTSSSPNKTEQPAHAEVEKKSSPLFKPKLYKVGIGMGYLELPQVRASSGRLVLTRQLLDTRGVYILDCYTDIFVWIGLKSTRLVRTAALKLSASLDAMINRPDFTVVSSTLEGTESQVFKSKFEGWDDLIAVDYTRSAEMVNRKNANFKRQLAVDSLQSAVSRDADTSGSPGSGACSHLSAPNSTALLSANALVPSHPKDHFGHHCSNSVLPPLLQSSSEPLKTDLVALFVDRYVPVSDEEAIGMMDEMNDFLESMECFVFENKKFVRLPEKEFGQFYSEDSYLFVCKYWKIDETAEAEKKNNAPAGGEEEDEEEEDEVENTIECKLYFWQGRDANNAGWLTFTFSLKKKFKDIEIIKLNQQQESPQFLSHFKRKFIVHKGKRKQSSLVYRGKYNQEKDKADQEEQAKKTKMFQLRKNPHSAICTRCIQLDKAVAQSLCSQFCYLVVVPFDNLDYDGTMGIVYVWLGSESEPEEARLAEEMANEMYDAEYSIQVLSEGEEPDVFFWHSLDGKKHYDTSAVYMDYMRLFRCSNDRGYFAVTEKCIDFCQDDLSDDDIMILDTGENVYLWIGPQSTEIVVKLAFKSAQVYIQHLKNKQPKRPRKLLLTTKTKEAAAFTKCFHAWSKHRNVPTNLEKKIILKPKAAAINSK